MTDKKMEIEAGSGSEAQPKEKEISNEELQVYDRQRFIGVEVQKRLLNARVLLCGVNGVNTELAKNLILCGTSISIADSEIISQDDVETNFLIGPRDLGKIRGEVIKAKLNDMNPMVRIDLFQSFDVKLFFDTHSSKKDGSADSASNSSPFEKNFLNQFNIIASSVASFAETALYDKLSHEFNIPYYNLLCCGLYGFFYVSLGSAFECTLQKPTSVKMRVVGGKLIKESPGYEYFHKATINSSSFGEIDTANLKGAKPVFSAIQMMKKAEDQGFKYDPYLNSAENDQILQKIVNLAENKIQSDDGKEFYTNFAKFFGIEHCPVYSVIGSVASQEFIKVIAKDKMPALNWFIYDSQIGYGKVESTSAVINASYIDLPELTRKIEEQPSN